MKSLIILLLVSQLFAEKLSINDRQISDNTTKYFIQCIEDYQFIQFLEPAPRYSTGYVKNGVPVQIFVEHPIHKTSQPLKCDKKD